MEPELHRPTFPVVVAGASLIALVVVILISVNQARSAAADGRQAHAVFCVYKDDLLKRRANSEAFLKMTPAQRVKKYGDALGTIPEPVIRQGLRAENDILTSLRGLRCP